MNSLVIQNVSKNYQVNKLKNWKYHTSFRKELLDLIKKPLSFKRYGNEETIWALKNINFSLQEGEALGIIGRNGSGKTTLLKIISRVTSPTSGEIVLNGKVAAILEIGLGFHPELTGRENIYLNGALLGYSKRAVEKQFSEIIDFSGIKKFIDTPIKYYSSGMQARLAFSIATSLEEKPDILLLDEVFAVGDNNFHQQSLKRITNLTRESKTTVLFVSHDLSAVKTICRKCLWLDQGQIRMLGETQAVIKAYLHFSENLDKTNVVS